MMRAYFAFLVLGFWFLAFPLTARAAIVDVSQDGDTHWNVLSYQDEYGKAKTIALEKVAEVEDTLDAKITLSRGDKYKLTLDEGNETRVADVSNFDGDIVEVARKNDFEKVRIGRRGDGYVIEHQGVAAYTDYAISVDPRHQEFSVDTDTGERVLAILPGEAVSTLTRPRIITSFGDDSVRLAESSNGELMYEVNGERTMKFLNFIRVSTNVRSLVSATTGEVLSVDAPIWVSIIGELSTG